MICETTRRALAALLLSLALLAPAAAAEPGPGFDPELERFVYAAVAEGLAELRLPDAVVDRLLEVDPATGHPVSFIPGCPVCTPALSALRDWRARADRASSPTAAPPELLAELSQDRDLGRTAALGRLLQQLVTRRIAAAGWTEEESAAWSKRFQAAGAEGQRQLQAHQARGEEAYKPMWSCMLCDGAGRACPKP